MIQPLIGQPTTPRSKSTASHKSRKEANSSFIAPRLKAHENFLPSDESLATLVRSALESLRQGIVWDRGSIVNLKL